MSESQTVRLNRYIADSGLCSRREADRLISEGIVTIDGQIAVLGQRVEPDQTVRVRGEIVLPHDQPVYLVLHKPAGITCTTDSRRRDNIVDFIGYPQRIYPIGRLDRDSEGLIFLTNDGSIVNKILRAGNRHDKEYRVTVDQPLTGEFLQGMASGVPILDTVTKPCKIRPSGSHQFTIILTQGLNRQIRRMCEYFGYSVVRLVRTRIMHITLSGLKSGEWRHMTAREVHELHRLTRGSRHEPPAGDPADDTGSSDSQ